MLSDRVYRQREQNRILENRLEQQRIHSRQLQNQLDRQRIQNRHMQQRVEDSRNRSILMRERMEQQRRSHQVRENIHQQRIYRSNESRLLNRQSNTQNRQMPVRSPRSNSLRAPWEQYGS